MEQALTRRDALELIKAEGLTGYVWFGEDPARADCMVIQHTEGEWRLFYTDERGVPWPKSVRVYATESEALVDFIARLRRLNLCRQEDRKLFDGRS